MTENPTIAEPIDPGAGSGTATDPGPSTTASAPPPPMYAPVRKLFRSRSDRVLGGVCGGIGRHYDMDPVLLRILVVVATVFTGGVFLLAYVLAWAFIPDEPAYWAPAPVAPQPGYVPAAYAAGGTGSYVDPGTGQVYGAAPYTYVPPPRTEPRSYLGLLTVSAALVVGALLGLANTLGASISGLAIFSSILLVLGAGLLVGAWRGRARWLIAPALVVLLLVQGTAAVHHLVGNASGLGDRRWTPTASAQTFELGAGSAVLDLSKAPTGSSAYTAKVGLGELRVVLPADTQLVLDATVGVGEIDLPKSPTNDGTNLTSTATVPALTTTAVRTVTLKADLGLGSLVVRRATS
ncbi:MAG TPA: PspC domain-containing protein [Candidatus Nanopelagicales bacterium]|nr:PspC domain-containing protein [Candidatus Nanopelagicales bacterium]